VYLVGHGWHVGLALPLADVPAAAWPESLMFRGFRFVEVGWGDGDFYPAARGTVGQALAAAFRSRSSVLHVAAFDPPVAEFFPAAPIVEIPLSPGGLEALTRFVHGAFARTAGGEPIAVAPSVYGHGRFYRATGHYHLLRNSNTWAAEALRAAGCPIEPRRAITAGSVLDAARGFGRVPGPIASRETARTPAPRASCR
jgi:uncharacterized protein (TIGR02117 family)